MSGISAQYVDGLEIMIAELREQVEKLTKERDDLLGYKKYWKEWLNLQSGDARQIAERAEYADALEQQLAALAEQNEKMRKVLLRLACLGNGDQYGNSIGNCIAQEALSLPDLATPVLDIGEMKRLIKLVKAEENEACAKVCESKNPPPDQWSDMSEVAEQRAVTNCAEAIRARMKP